MGEVYSAQAIGPEDIERDGHDGKILRNKPSPGWIRLEGGWFQVQRPARVSSFMLGPVSERAAPLRQEALGRIDATMDAAKARGALVQMQRIAARYGVPTVEPVMTDHDQGVEESRRLEAIFNEQREALKADIIAAHRRRTWRLRAWLAVIVAASGLTVWGIASAPRLLAKPQPEAENRLPSPPNGGDG